MPDMKPPQTCDYPSTPSIVASAGSFADFLTAMEPCIAKLSISTDPLSSLSCHGVSLPHCHSYQGPALPHAARCNSSSRLLNPGRYCPGRLGPIGVEPSIEWPPGCDDRPYRSMENLNRKSISDSCKLRTTSYRSMENGEFILRYSNSNHWFDGPPDGAVMEANGIFSNSEKVAFYPRHGFTRKDLTLCPQFLFPFCFEEWDARKGLRDKLRLQSARSVLHLSKPLRPQGKPGSSPIEQENVTIRNSLGTTARPLGTRITSPEDIKQEVLRRLQLRRQNSSPNLALHNSLYSPIAIKTSFTTENISGIKNSSDFVSEHTRPSVGHLHIPTFEEFKRMRHRESNQGSDSKIVLDQTKHQSGSSYTMRCNLQEANKSSERTSRNVSSSKERISSSIVMNGSDTPIQMGPSPCPLLQPQPNLVLEKAVTARNDDGGTRRRRSSLERARSISFPPCRENCEQPSSCCPALLLEGTDLSHYGAKIYKMKDELIGSALDLIKKSCSAEISAEAPVRLSHDQNGACDITAPSANWQPSVVAMATPAMACGANADDDAPARDAAGYGEAKEHPGALGCRGSSSNAADETVRSQRECRLRPHYSDPMPSDDSKRKQLEMKIGTATRIQRRDRCRDSAPAALRGHSEPTGEERQPVRSVTHSFHHRWSTISSLSADSGVLGLSDEREEEESKPKGHHHGAEVERADSGIGPGLSRSWKRPSCSLRAWEAQRPCPDCGLRDGASKDRGGPTCERCSKLRIERKEAIMEFLNTETSYGEDLRIIKEEFYCPMQSAGLLTVEQLAVVFGNAQELIDVNDRFTEHLQDCIDQAFDQGDENLLTVYIGGIFLEFVNMLPAFQTYCLQQSTSVNMLNTLEKEKELLRIFLDVSQNDNTALRRMNLRSFLMAPLQRVTKYPLLLSRIIKVTPECHPDYARLREAKSRVESHLEHINMKTKQDGNGITWSLRSFRRDSRKNREVINIEMREVSMKTVGWSRENTRFVMEGPLQLSQPTDGQWAKKGSKALKFQNVQSLLMVRTQGCGEASGQENDPGAPSDRGEVVRDGVLVLIKDKSSGKFTVLREPIHLGNCVVSTDPDSEDTFEILDIRKESFIFRASDKSRTQQWFHQIKRYARDLGSWRKRRNALPNIMINTNQPRS